MGIKGRGKVGKRVKTCIPFASLSMCIIQLLKSPPMEVFRERNTLVIAL
jgi:hypothetical protein